MDRRDFIRLSAAGVGAGMVAPAMALADSGKQAAGSIYYTKDAPGRWSDKVATHLPNIEIEKAGVEVVVKIVTAHEMKGYEHYIVKHVLLDQSYKFIGEYLFKPDKDKAAVSTYTLHDYSGPIYALSMCNKHDLWLNGAEV
ncbi:MAG: twin-arginine translocation signal domain-containing protein [Methylobacter tundripaludum]|uniref:Superoxide reductase n=1 Tax=Methylobacter tundripaludum TaxID=173365 RepID=A0A2S6H2K8_9GAMM|nr:desulfoferrodoxin family protein [Methylobacter tundripaludum]MCF7966261.1 twin-arginine translocation signal domain-containing protein [Methylobacter tundripaludum]PPK71646.1 superoxide reductase [Methylobacter tundripaludum]